MKKTGRIFIFLTVCLSAAFTFAGRAAAVFAEEEGGATDEGSFAQFLSDYWILIVLLLLVAAWFVYSGFRRKKQVQEGQDMLNSIKPGVHVMTQGGLIGKVVEIIVISPTEKHVVLETGGEGNKSQITYDIRAIGMVLKPERLTPGVSAEETVMPTDEEVQKRLDDIYAPDAAAPPQDADAKDADKAE